MSPEKVVELAKQSGLDAYETLEEGDGNFAAIQRFAQLVRNETLEEAAEEFENLYTDQHHQRHISNVLRSLKS